MKIILASKSPRRKQLLKKVVSKFEIVESKVKEFDWKNKTYSQNATWNAYRKAKKVSEKFPDRLVLGADTIVILKAQILGKPKNLKDAKRMLGSLSGQAHEVITGVCLLQADPKIRVEFYDLTKVKMKKLTLQDIDNYVKKVHVLDKAGSYGIQENPKIIQSIQGSYSNVMGLPVEKLRMELRKLR